MAKPEYPKILTVAAWNKEKGLLARATVKTGVTPLLERAEKLYKTAPWNDIANNAKAFQSLEQDYHRIGADLYKIYQTVAKDASLKKYAETVKQMSDAAVKFSHQVAWGSVKGG